MKQKLYTKTIDGQKIIKLSSNIVIYKNGMQIINPSESMLLEDGWEPIVSTNYNDLSEEDILAKQLENAKNQLIFDIEIYDSSQNINVFYVNDTPMWLDKATRVGLRLRFESELNIGMQETVLWYEDTPFPLQLETALQMLHAIELYASKCYDNTKQHIYNVKQLTNIETVNSYDYKTGYPEPLIF